MQLMSLPLNNSECLLFLNGEKSPLPMDLLQKSSHYKQIVVADGAWDALQSYDIVDSVDMVMGDGDSIVKQPKHFVELANQDATDFEKILADLVHKGFQSVDVYWASGLEMDHFLGNLSVAAKYHQQITCRFYDENQCYFYLTTDCAISQACGKKLSIYPFPAAKVSSQGLLYEMTDCQLQLTRQQSLRNQIINQKAILRIEGGIFLFLSVDSYERISR